MEEGEHLSVGVRRSELLRFLCPQLTPAIPSTPYTPAARTAASGSVVTQASKMPRTVLTWALPFTTPMPNREPTETCVVETGSPQRLAVVTRTAVTRLAVNPCPGFMRVILRLMVSATRRAL